MSTSLTVVAPQLQDSALPLSKVTTATPGEALSWTCYHGRVGDTDPPSRRYASAAPRLAVSETSGEVTVLVRLVDDAPVVATADLVEAGHPDRVRNPRLEVRDRVDIRRLIAHRFVR